MTPEEIAAELEEAAAAIPSRLPVGDEGVSNNNGRDDGVTLMTTTVGASERKFLLEAERDLATPQQLIRKLLRACEDLRRERDAALEERDAALEARDSALKSALETHVTPAMTTAESLQRDSRPVASGPGPDPDPGPPPPTPPPGDVRYAGRAPRPAPLAVNVSSGDSRIRPGTAGSYRPGTAGSSRPGTAGCIRPGTAGSGGSGGECGNVAELAGTAEMLAKENRHLRAENANMYATLEDNKELRRRLAELQGLQGD